jgi:hypothetical protein
MSNALRIDCNKGSDDDYMVVSAALNRGLTFMVVDQNEDGDNFDALTVDMDVNDVKMLADYLLAWLERMGKS